MKPTNIIIIMFAFFSGALVFIGCGSEEHSPYVKCINIGVENVRRNLHIIASIDVGRQPLDGVSPETVRLLKLPEGTPLSGEIYSSGNRIAFIPDSKLLDSTEYRFEINDGIEDASGKAMPPMHQDFWTGELLQVYRVDLLRSYSAADEDVNSIGIYFSEGVDSALLSMNISVLEDGWTPQFFNIVYYKEVALAVLVFSYPLELNKNYTLTISANLLSETDPGRLDGDRDGEEIDNDPFTLNFMYKSDIVEGIIVADSSTNAMDYYEPTERCFLEEFGL